MSDSTRHDPSRRRLLQLLAAAGITGPAALDLAAAARHQVSFDNLKNAVAIIDQDFDDARLKVIQAALQKNLDEFQLVRDLEIDDSVEPALAFDSTRR